MKDGESRDEIYKECLMSIYSIIFFGVPHRGIRNDEWLAMVQGQPNQALVEALTPGSQYLEQLFVQFSSAFDYPDSKVISFYETEETQVAQVCGLR